MTEGYWLIKEDDPSYAPYKNDILREFEDALRDRGITDSEQLHVFAAQAMQENGSLSPLTIGDHGCSLGLPQRNFCSAAGISAAKAMKKWPEWQTLEFQIAWFADAAKGNLDAYGDLEWAVVAHNCPHCARNRHNNGYWDDVTARKKILEWKV